MPMIDSIPRVREWPANDLALLESVVGFLEFVSVTAINKLEGLSEEQARATPLATSTAMSLLGLIKHLTAGHRQHIQRHIGGSELPSLWRADDTTFEFRLGPDETIATVVAAFDDELKRSRDTLASMDPEASVLAYERPTRVGRVLVDFLQESARHLGHIDIVREVIDGKTGE